MSYGQDGNKVAYPASVDLSARRWCAVVKTSGKLAVAAAGSKILGILQDDPKQDESGTVKTRDTSKAVAGGTFADGADLAVGANGRLVAAAAGDEVVAQALEAGVDGRIVAVRLDRGGVVPAP
jgi:hypothetical protein